MFVFGMAMRAINVYIGTKPLIHCLGLVHVIHRRNNISGKIILQISNGNQLLKLILRTVLISVVNIQVLRLDPNRNGFII